ncbi:uncharacterized protein N7484_008712 [Penicillium longicatenatum]|uniref:uncharacterized protein n=1 Tax=Penicillium longicatenatum TaxID=1561947 RepID=UPI00254947FB|nr:uncharacterized protein N7484_008712 [Penicillium longicatenatum]KAJ5635399.1 hypothetical protein N7484_008712 [Penicillium longicatenatum]
MSSKETSCSLPHWDHPPDPNNPRKSSTDAVVHHLYFEDNDSFFPPTWIGKDDASLRRSSKDSSTSHGSKDEHDATTKPENPS